MHPRLLLASVLAMSVSGCDLIDQSKHPQWALIDKPKIQAAIIETIRKQNPYPAELDNDYKGQLREYERTNQQVSDLMRSGRQRCLQQNAPEQARKERNAPDGFPPMPIALSSSYAGMGRPTPEMQACLQGVEKDQLILDLRAKAEAFNDLQMRRREHDMRVQKIMGEAIDAATERYARANGFKLVLTNESSIAYNQSEQLLDITPGIIKEIQNAPATR